MEVFSRNLDSLMKISRRKLKMIKIRQTEGFSPNTCVVSVTENFLIWQNFIPILNFIGNCLLISRNNWASVDIFCTLFTDKSLLLEQINGLPLHINTYRAHYHKGKHGKQPLAVPLPGPKKARPGPAWPGLASGRA